MVFDTTDQKVAKENELPTENLDFGPVIIRVGDGNVIQGLDLALEGKEVGKSYTVEVPPEQGFGKKDVKLIQLISTSKFLKQNVQPIPGLQVNMDGTVGTIKTVSGGRTLVDFNHPLSSKELIYNIKINKLITDDKEKLTSFLKVQLNQKDLTAEIKEGTATITLKQELPKELTEILNKKISEIIPSVKKLNFTVKQEPVKKPDTSKETPLKDTEKETKK
jgi:FKBP-type peptidyl-prolyl cis-trans isomerase 2